MTDATSSPPARMNAAAESKAQSAWTMRVAGMPWAKIATALGYSDDKGAMRAVRNYAGTIPQPDRDTSRAVWRERLERLWAQAEADVEDQRPGAVRAAVAVAQRASLLDALDVPAVTLIASPTAAEFDDVVRSLVAARNPDPPAEFDIFDGDVIDAEVVDEP